MALRRTATSLARPLHPWCDRAAATSAAGGDPPLLAFEDVYIDAASLTPREPSQEQLSKGAPLTAMVLHGLLGSSRNLRTFARKLGVAAAREHASDVRLVLVDLRAHGASANRPGFHPPHTLAAAAGDVLQLVRSQLAGGTPHILAGMSLGGKVALEALSQLTRQQGGEGGGGERPRPPAGARQGDPPSLAQPPLPLPEQVWVLDSQPGAVPSDADADTSVGRIISLITQVPTPLPSREALYRHLSSHGIPTPVALWLGSNLVAREGGGRGGRQQQGQQQQELVWTFDIQGAAALYHSYRLSSYWDVFSCPPPSTSVHFVRGERSDRWTPAMLTQLEEAAARNAAERDARAAAVGPLHMHLLPRAGHWLQADNPDGLMQLMLPWF